MKIQRHQFPSIEQVKEKFPKNKQAINYTDSQTFHSILYKKIEQVPKLTFSKHANERLLDRNIKLSEQQLKRLEDGVSKAEKKGIKESLVLMDEIAFVVNIKNKKVITAIEQKESNKQIFTNIDGAVII